jgi:FkbM family methyltransferase
MDLISHTLHYIGKTYPKASVIQIGAMDGINFDDTRGFLDMYKWKSLLIEPVPALFEELKNNFKDRENYTFEQCAITEHDGEVEMLTVPPETILKENLHPGYKGMSALYPLKNGFGSDYQRDIDVKAQFGINIKVPSLTFDSLLKKHNIENFDILICDAEGYDWNIFKQIDLDKYRPKFIRLEYINLTDEEKQLTKEKLEKAGYIVSIEQDIDAVDSLIWDKIQINTPVLVNTNLKILDNIKSQLGSLNSEEKTKLLEYLNNPQVDITNNDLTLVTGLWNISRVGRDFDHYIENFKKFLNIPVKMFIYVPKDLEYLVWEKRSRDNTHVRTYELEDIKNGLYAPFWDKTQEIRTDPKWLNQTGENGWLTNSPQASNEWYNPIVQSKMFMLHDAKILNVFDTDYFIWLDAGITNTVYEKYFTDNKCLDKLIPHLNTFLFLSYPYQADSEIHGFDFKAINKYAREEVKYVCRGGLFGGHKDFLSQANGTYYHLLQDTLASGYMGTEESLFSVMAHLEPHIYRRYALDENGLIVKFIQDLMDDNVRLENNGGRAHVLPKGVYNPNTSKTSLYMLTFNFPEQIEHTVATWETNSPDWMSKPRKILLDNSTDENARIKNQELAVKYNFEYIPMEGNVGINGGRLFAAKHFQESDSDYYFFFEDDMGLYSNSEQGFCRNGFKNHIPDLYRKVHDIMAKEDFDFLKLSFTEVYMDNNIQVSWYNVPQSVRTYMWPDYDQLPISGIDPYAPRTKFDKIDTHNELSYISGEIYYANWPMIVSKKGNQKMFLDVQWEHPFEQTWMSYMFQETVKGNIKPAVLLASPVLHNRIVYYKPEERREN